MDLGHPQPDYIIREKRHCRERGDAAQIHTILDTWRIYEDRVYQALSIDFGASLKASIYYQTEWDSSVLNLY